MWGYYSPVPYVRANDPNARGLEVPDNLFSFCFFVGFFILCAVAANIPVLSSITGVSRELFESGLPCCEHI